MVSTTNKPTVGTAAPSNQTAGNSSNSGPPGSGGAAAATKKPESPKKSSGAGVDDKDVDRVREVEATLAIGGPPPAAMKPQCKLLPASVANDPKVWPYLTQYDKPETFESYIQALRFSDGDPAVAVKIMADLATIKGPGRKWLEERIDIIKSKDATGPGLKALAEKYQLVFLAKLVVSDFQKLIWSDVVPNLGNTPALSKLVEKLKKKAADEQKKSAEKIKNDEVEAAAKKAKDEYTKGDASSLEARAADIAGNVDDAKIIRKLLKASEVATREALAKAIVEAKGKMAAEVELAELLVSFAPADAVHVLKVLRENVAARNAAVWLVKRVAAFTGEKLKAELKPFEHLQSAGIELLKKAESDKLDGKMIDLLLPYFDEEIGEWLVLRAKNTPALLMGKMVGYINGKTKRAAAVKKTFEEFPGAQREPVLAKLPQIPDDQLEAALTATLGGADQTAVALWAVHEESHKAGIKPTDLYANGNETLQGRVRILTRIREGANPLQMVARNYSTDWTGIYNAGFQLLTKDVQVHNHWAGQLRAKGGTPKFTAGLSKVEAEKKLPAPAPMTSLHVKIGDKAGGELPLAGEIAVAVKEAYAARYDDEDVPFRV